MNEIRNLLIGIDFGKVNTQVCYYDRKAEEPRSLSLKAGESIYEIPTGLSEGGRDLYSLSGLSESEPGEKEPWESTAQFLKSVLRYLGMNDIVHSTSALAVTAEELTPERVSNLKKACVSLGFSEDNVILLDYEESFYYHVMTQRKELPSRSTAWYRFAGETCVFRKMTINSKLKPIRVKIEDPVMETLPEDPEKRDEAFSIFIQKTLGQEMFSSIQITGEGFDTTWAVRSTRILCFGKRRVYYGNNLYARGACAAAKEKTEDHSLRNFLFHSRSLVRNEIGMNMRVMGAAAYYTMIRSGSNWYECACTCEIILNGTEELVFEVTMENEAEVKRIAMKLPGLPARPPKTTRLLLDLRYVSREKCRISVTDLGFGEMFPSCGKTWTEMVEWKRESAQTAGQGGDLPG